MIYWGYFHHKQVIFSGIKHISLSACKDMKYLCHTLTISGNHTKSSAWKQKVKPHKTRNTGTRKLNCYWNFDRKHNHDAQNLSKLARYRPIPTNFGTPWHVCSVVNQRKKLTMKFKQKSVSSESLFQALLVCDLNRTPNYANPVYGFATICHQVRCLRWGHLSLFYTATSLLILYKMLCMRDISYRLIWMKFINMLS